MERYLTYIALSLVLYRSASSGSHSHYFYRTVTSDNSSSDSPFYYETRTIDDVTLYWYDSHSGVIERRVPWFTSAHDNLLFASIDLYNLQFSQRDVLNSFRNHTNDIKGFHVLQQIEGCVLYENQSTDTLVSYHYDGKPFLSFSLEKAIWTAEDPRAQYLADINNQNQTLTEDTKNILVDTCLPHITELLAMGSCTLSRKEQPVVTVTRTAITSSTSRLNCRAYGHYPKTISMTWYKNGEPVPESLMERVTLPYPDITYLTWLTMNITQNNDDVYFCSIDHISLTSPLIADWRVSGESAGVSRGISNGGIIAICLAAMLVLFLVVFGAVSFAKSRRQ